MSIRQLFLNLGEEQWCHLSPYGWSTHVGICWCICIPLWSPAQGPIQHQLMQTPSWPVLLANSLLKDSGNSYSFPQSTENSWGLSDLDSLLPCHSGARMLLPGYLSTLRSLNSSGNCAVQHVIVSEGCCNKLTQTGWLITTETVLEARSLKSRHQEGHALSEGARGGSS